MITDHRYSHTTYSQLSKDDLKEYDCPKCGVKHRTKYYSHYKRHVASLDTEVLAAIIESDIEQGNIDIKSVCQTAEYLYNDTILDVFRVICESCGATHAILPGDVVPYRRFSLLTMLAIVKVMYHREHTIEKTSKHLQLSWQYMLSLLNQWISQLSRMALLMRAVYQECVNELEERASQRAVSFFCSHRASFPLNYQKEYRKIIFMSHSQIHKGKKIALGLAANQ